MSNQLSAEDLWARDLPDHVLAQKLDGLNRRGLYSPKEREAIQNEAARRLRWGRKSESETMKPFTYEDVLDALCDFELESPVVVQIPDGDAVVLYNIIGAIEEDLDDVRTIIIRTRKKL